MPRLHSARTASLVCWLCLASCGVTSLLGWPQRATGQEPTPPSDRHARIATEAARTTAGSEWWRLATLRDYNTRMVVFGTTLLGLSAGIVGAFTLLRKRALIGDVVGHSALPGIGIAFLVMEGLERGSGKSLPGLLLGALVAGVAGVLCTIAIRRLTRIKDDAALAIVLSVFYGAGIVLFTVIQRIQSGAQAGLNGFLFGGAAALVASDVQVIALGSSIVIAISLLLFKEFAVLCFDDRFAASQGWPVLWLDVLLMGLAVGVCVIGLQSVGLLLVAAMLIIPAASARFWTDRVGRLGVVSGVTGFASAYVGVLLSASIPKLPAGAIIVLSGSGFFTVSLLLGTRRGAVRRFVEQSRVRRRVKRQHLLRAIYERVESSLGAESIETALRERNLTPRELLVYRSWTLGELTRLCRVAVRDGALRDVGHDGFRLTAEGVEDARRVTRNHRLWELYLIHHADIAPSHVDRDADEIEHVLGPEVVDELTQLLEPAAVVPPSPHSIAPSTTKAS